MPDQSWWTPATGGYPLTQGGRFPNRRGARKRKFRGRSGSGFQPLVGWLTGWKPVPLDLTRAQIEGFHGFATGQLANALDDLVAVEKELIAHDRVRGEHDE